VTTNIDALHLRRTFGRQTWAVPEAWGDNGWLMRRRDEHGGGSVVVSCMPWPLAAGEEEWVHASIAFPDRMPGYEDLTTLHTAVWKGKGWAYQVFPPDEDKINLHEFALHLWGRLDGEPVLPDFVTLGGVRSI
jgi:hypothetical protein